MRWIVAFAMLLAGSAFAAPTVSPPIPQSVSLQPTARLAEVATRATIPNYFSAANTQFQSRSLHWTRQTLTSVQVCFPNWYTKAGPGDTATGGAATITASFEYPLGTFHQLLFSGSATGAVASGGTLCSDAYASAIPNYAEFAVREHYSNPSGIVVVAYGVNTVLNFDALNFGTNVADQTMGGTVGNTLAIFAAYPAAIIAQSVRPSACLYGDSRAFGLLHIRSDATGDGGELAPRIGPSLAYINMGVPSDIVSGTISSVANRKALSQYCSIGIDELGINDVASNVAPATIASDRTIFANDFAPMPMYGTTLVPYTTTTDACATTANQSLQSFEANRVTFNALVRAGIPGEINYIDLSDMIDPTRSGKWPVNGSANGYAGDTNNICLHENAAGAGIIAQSPLWPNIDFNRY